MENQKPQIDYNMACPSCGCRWTDTNKPISIYVEIYYCIKCAKKSARMSQREKDQAGYRRRKVKLKKQDKERQHLLAQSMGC